MRIFRSVGDVPDSIGPSAVAIGKFDGLHAGHRAVLEGLRRSAAERDLVPAVVTFDRNPLEVLAPERAPEALVSLDQKLDLLERSGIAVTLVARFDERFAALAPEEFVETVLVGALNARLVLVGGDFRFGAKGSGDANLLLGLGRRHGFEVEFVDDVVAAGTRASSTLIRKLLGEGRVAEAAGLLDRPHSVRSKVVHGQQRGRQLGFPTANLDPDIEGLVPADGVYAGWLVVDGTRHPAAISIGNNPTFEGVPERQVEAHAIDRDFDLYGKTVEVEFVEFVRGMLKLGGMAELRTQIQADVQQVRQILGA